MVNQLSRDLCRRHCGSRTLGLDRPSDDLVGHRLSARRCHAAFLGGATASRLDDGRHRTACAAAGGERVARMGADDRHSGSLGITCGRRRRRTHRACVSQDDYSRSSANRRTCVVDRKHGFRSPRIRAECRLSTEGAPGRSFGDRHDPSNSRAKARRACGIVTWERCDSTASW